MTVRVSEGREYENALGGQAAPGITEGLDGVVFAAHRYCKWLQKQGYSIG